MQLYRERIRVTELEKEKKVWMQNKERLRIQYTELLE